MHTRGRLTTGFSKPSKGTRFLRARALGGLVEIPGEGNAEAHSSGSLSAMMAATAWWSCLRAAARWLRAKKWRY